MNAFHDPEALIKVLCACRVGDGFPTDLRHALASVRSEVKLIDFIADDTGPVRRAYTVQVWREPASGSVGEVHGVEPELWRQVIESAGWGAAFRAGELRLTFSVSVWARV